MRPSDLTALTRAIRLGAPPPALRAASPRAACPSAGRRGARFGRRGGGAAPNPYSPAASAIMLPYTAIWITTSGLTLADGDTTVDSWLAGWGGIRPTLTAPAATNRPAYTAGAVPVVTTDGVDNVLRGTVTKGSLWTDVELGGVFSRVAFGSASDHAFGYGVPNSVVIRIDDASASLMRSVGGTNVSFTTDPDGVTAHWSTDQSTGVGTNNARKTGAVEASAGSTFTNRADGGTANLGGNGYTLAAFGNYAFRAVYLGPALTADQRTYLRALLTYHTGVAS